MEKLQKQCSLFYTETEYLVEEVALALQQNCRQVNILEDNGANGKDDAQNGCNDKNGGQQDYQNPARPDVSADIGSN